MERLIKSSIEVASEIAAKKIIVFFQKACKLAHSFLMANVYFGKSKAGVPENSIIFFPYTGNVLNCGLAGIVSFKGMIVTRFEINPIRLVWKKECVFPFLLFINSLGISFGL